MDAHYRFPFGRSDINQALANLRVEGYKNYIRVKNRYCGTFQTYK